MIFFSMNIYPNEFLSDLFETYIEYFKQDYLHCIKIPSYLLTYCRIGQIT